MTRPPTPAEIREAIALLVLTAIALVISWTFFLVCCVALALSAFYEFIEWWVALLLGRGAMEFLGTQGDPWDTQWDMFLCLIGAITARLLLSRIHDRQLARLAK